MKFHVVIVMQYILGRLGVVWKPENVNISMQSKRMDVKKSALCQHIVDFDHFIAWDEAKILKNGSQLQ